MRLNDGPDPGADDLWTRLGTLPRPQQAALVLHHHDGGTTATLARLLHRTGPEVDDALARGAAALDGPDPAVLAAVLHEHAADAPDATELRERRHARQRRRELLAVAVVAALVVVAAGVPLSHLTGTVAGAARVVPLASPAQYLGGSHLVGSALVDPATGRASVSFTPTGAGVILATSCDSAAATTSTSANGAPLYSGRCGGTATFAAAEQDAVFPGGEPATVSLTLDSGTGAAQLAVYEATTLDDYVFPPPPDDPTAAPSYGTALASAATLGANASTTVVLALGTTTRLFVSTAAPGVVAVRVDGTTVSTVTSRGTTPTTTPVDLAPATLAGLGLTVRGGDRIQVEIETSRFSAPGWVVSATQ